MHRKLSPLALAIFCVAPLVVLSACGEGVVAVRSGNPAFNGTFTGEVRVNTPPGPVRDSITTTLTVGSPLRGTFRLRSLEIAGTVAGDATGDQATFTFTITGACPGTLQGSMDIALTLEGPAITIDASGSDCNGDLDFRGVAHQSEHLV